MSNLPRIMIAAPKSGSGKTIFTCGLLNLLAKEGGASFGAKGVAAFKCGPDYIDPMFHRKVIGVESENLDSFFSTRDEIKGIISRAQGKAAVLEGVMGIYDGIGGASGKGSCYEVASITETPILLVLNGSGIGNTLIALAEGILKNDTNGLIKGIVINQTSETYYKALLPGFEDMLSEYISLVTYMPMLMGTGGNSGSQSSTLIIRALATEDVQISDALRVLWKEARIGIRAEFPEDNIHRSRYCRCGAYSVRSDVHHSHDSKMRRRHAADTGEGCSYRSGTYGRTGCVIAHRHDVTRHLFCVCVHCARNLTMTGSAYV